MLSDANIGLYYPLKICSAATLHLIGVLKLLLKEFVLPSVSLLNKIIEDNINAVNIPVNLLYMQMEVYQRI